MASRADFPEPKVKRETITVEPIDRFIIPMGLGSGALSLVVQKQGENIQLTRRERTSVTGQAKEQTFCINTRVAADLRDALIDLLGPRKDES